VLNDDRISKGVADIRDAEAEIRKFIACGKDAFLSEKKNALALRYLLIEAVEAITDICQHILAKARGVACGGYVDCIVKAGEQGLIKAELTNKLRKLADLRNSLIHRYWIINDDELFTQCGVNIGDLSDFTVQISLFLSLTKAENPSGDSR
jgi:uncharacterized protein YutE (UPF0331/DUF86 family)